MIRIGLIGRARSGKSTVAGELVAMATQHAITAKQYDIGQAVLDFCINAGRIPRKNRADLNPAELHTLVYVGKQMREKSPDFWLGKIASDADRDSPAMAIVPNVRYWNEVDWVRNEGTGYLIRVVALNENGSEFISPDRDPNHVSETELRNTRADFVLTAYKGQPQLLRDYAAGVFREIKKRSNE